MQKARKICLQQKPSESGYQRMKAQAFRYPYAGFPLQCENQSQGFGNKAFSKGKRRGATCSIRSGTFANHAEGTELQSIRYLSSGSVPEEEKCFYKCAFYKKSAFYKSAFYKKHFFYKKKKKSAFYKKITSSFRTWRCHRDRQSAMKPVRQ